MRAACLVVVAAIGLLAAAGITEVAARRFNPIHEGAQRYRAHQQMRADQGLPDEYQQNPSGGDYSYYTVWTKYTLDHFNFRSSVSEGGENSFPARYLVNDNSFQKPTPTQPECGPIFFYTGNEGPVDAFANATGFMFDLAPKFNALLIFAEHRYYGESLPFGENSFTPENLQYLSSEQALSDYVELIPQIKASYGCPVDTPVIAFGGSYGGMLTGWMRLRYPHVVAGGIAASAPLLMYPADNNSTTYSNIATRTFTTANPACSAGIAQSWSIMTEMGSTAQGLQELSQAFQLCTPLTQASDVENILFPWLANSYSTLPMGDYPYPTSFLGPLPGNPVNVACQPFTEGMSQPELLAAIASVQNLFYNYTGAAGSCNNPAAEEGNGTGGFAAGDTWPYQTCTEQVLPVGQYGLPSDMFYVAPWTQQGWDASCQQQFGTTTRPNWILESFGDAAGFARSAGNIVFSNGDRDPWSGGGVLEDINASIVYNPVVGGAHHYDLRATNPADTPGVLTARQIHAEFIQHWVEQARAESRAVKKGDRKKKRAQKVLTEQ